MLGLETVIDLIYLLAVQDIQHEVVRAGDAMPEPGRQHRHAPRTVALVDRVHHYPHPKAVTEGDVVDHDDPEDIAKMLVALWAGIRRISDLDELEHYIDNLEKAWILALPSFTNPDRIDYFTQFIKRRQVLVLKSGPLQIAPFGHGANTTAPSNQPPPIQSGRRVASAPQDAEDALSRQDVILVVVTLNPDKLAVVE